MRRILLLLLMGLWVSAINAQKTYVPDDNFEQALIDLGYDTGPLDDYVLTSKISSVQTLNISNKNIADLTGIQDFASLWQLDCRPNNLTTLNLSKNTNLNTLVCGSNKLTSLDLSKNINLITLLCESNQLASLDLSLNTNLKSLSCSSNQLSEINISKNLKLEYVECSNNQLKILDLSRNINLKSLSCGYNQLNALDVSTNIYLIALDFRYNQLLTINVNNNLYLQRLYFESNKLSSIDLSKNTNLTTLQCYSNNLTFIDLSKNINLTTLSCHSNKLTSLILKNGNNTKLGINVAGNPNLKCIQVDNPILAATYTNWQKDAHAVYSDDCSKMPVANAGADITVYSGNNVTLAGSVTPTELASSAKFLWKTPASIQLNSNNISNPTFTAPNVKKDTTFTLLLTVTSGNFTSTDEVLVTVKTKTERVLFLTPKASSDLSYTISRFDTTIIKGASFKMGTFIKLTGGSGAYTYRWSPGKGLSDSTILNPVAKPVEKTNYKLTVSDKYGCTIVANYTVNVNYPVFTSKIKSSTLIAEIYPNPNTGKFSLRIEGKPSVSLQISIFDSKGICIKKQVHGHFPGLLDLTYSLNLAPGYYNLQIQTNNGSYSKPFIINR